MNNKFLAKSIGIVIIILFLFFPIRILATDSIPNQGLNDLTNEMPSELLNEILDDAVDDTADGEVDDTTDDTLNKNNNKKLAILSKTTTEEENEKIEYMIYVRDYIDKNFKFAFSNMENAEEADLVYINSVLDSEGNKLAYLDWETYESLTNLGQEIYIWIKDEAENMIMEGELLDLNNSLDNEEIASIELITKRISVEIGDTKEKVDATEPIRQEEVDDVDEIAKVGYIKITDNESATYYYQIAKVSDSEDYNNLMQYTEKMTNEYNELNIFDKVQFCEEFYKIYSELIERAEWQEVENMTIYQPESSVAGDQYIVFIRKIDGENEIVDAQFLTAYDDYKENIITEDVVVEEIVKLPITADSIILFVLLGIIVIALIVVYVIIKKITKKENRKEER